MLKIPKGLKKKKKDKKHKRKGEDELFNEEELEKYRKEHQHQGAADLVEQSSEENAFSSTLTDKSDEWKKFNALTAGVDTILLKTQEDLDRIKSTSFFQRKAPAASITPENEKDVEVVDKKGEKVPAEKRDSQIPEDNIQETQKYCKEYKKDEDDSEEESEKENLADDNIFETSYVDAVASGELKLAYIPDSPIKEDDFDPFDTSIADKFIESNPKKRYLNLGCAVEVLSGKANPNIAVTLEKRTSKRRNRPSDLLLSSFDEETDQPSKTVVNIVGAYDSPVKTLLDDDPTFIDSDNSLLPFVPSPEVTSVPVLGNTNRADTVNVSKLDFSEFEISLASPIATLTEQLSTESVDDEFEKLAAESLSKKPSISEGPQRPVSINLSQKLADSTNAICISPVSLQYKDPFDTSATNKLLLPGKSEIKLIEKELLDKSVQLSHREDNDFDPRAKESQQGTQKLSTQVTTDFLTENHEEETFFVKPLTPLANTPEVDDFDPFDTSHVSGVPGKLELKLIEKELVTSNIENKKFEPKNTITEIILNKYNVSLTENVKSEEPVYVDILTGEEKIQDTESEKIPPPVEPKKFLDSDDFENTFIDPFDTSIADHIVPGKTELKVLENELIN